MGTVTVQVQVGPAEQGVEFHVLDVPATFNLLLGRPWLHQVKALTPRFYTIGYSQGRVTNESCGQ